MEATAAEETPLVDLGSSEVQNDGPSNVQEDALNVGSAEEHEVQPGNPVDEGDADAMFDELIRNAADDMLAGIMPGVNDLQDMFAAPEDEGQEVAPNEQQATPLESTEEDAEGAAAAMVAAAFASVGEDAAKEGEEAMSWEEQIGQSLQQGSHTASPEASTSAITLDHLAAQQQAEEQDPASQAERNLEQDREGTTEGGDQAPQQGQDENEDDGVPEDLDAQAAAMLGSAFAGFDFDPADAGMQQGHDTAKQASSEHPNPGEVLQAEPSNGTRQEAAESRSHEGSHPPTISTKTSTEAVQAEEVQEGKEAIAEGDDEFDEDAIARFAAEATSNAFSAFAQDQGNDGSQGQSLGQPSNGIAHRVDVGAEESEGDEDDDDDDEIDSDLDKEVEKLAQQALGLDENGNPLPGTELAKAAAHEMLNDAVKRMQGNAQAMRSSHPIVYDPFAAKPPNFPTHPMYAIPGLSASAKKVRRQEKKRERRFQCDKCSRAFTRAYNLHTHQATHDPNPTRAKPFICPYPSCQKDGGRSFSRKHDLQRHITSSHEGEARPIVRVQSDGSVVPLADKSKAVAAQNQKNAQDGLQVLGLEVPNRKFRCEKCGRAFVRRDGFSKHQCDKGGGAYQRGNRNAAAAKEGPLQDTRVLLHQQHPRPPSSPMFRPPTVKGQIRTAVSPATAAAAAAAIAAASASAGKGPPYRGRPPLRPRPPELPSSPAVPDRIAQNALTSSNPSAAEAAQRIANQVQANAQRRSGTALSPSPAPGMSLYQLPSYSQDAAAHAQGVEHTAEDDEDDEAQRMAEAAAAAMFSSVTEAFAATAT